MSDDQKKEEKKEEEKEEKEKPETEEEKVLRISKWYFRFGFLACPWLWGFNFLYIYQYKEVMEKLHDDVMWYRRWSFILFTICTVLFFIYIILAYTALFDIAPWVIKPGVSWRQNGIFSPACLDRPCPY